MRKRENTTNVKSKCNEGISLSARRQSWILYYCVTRIIVKLLSRVYPRLICPNPSYCTKNLNQVKSSLGSSTPGVTALGTLVPMAVTLVPGRLVTVKSHINLHQLERLLGQVED